MRRLKAILQILFAKKWLIATVKGDKWDVRMTFDEKDVTKSGNALYFK